MEFGRRWVFWLVLFSFFIYLQCLIKYHCARWYVVSILWCLRKENRSCKICKWRGLDNINDLVKLRYGMTSNNSVAYNGEGICPSWSRGRMVTAAYHWRTLLGLPSWCPLILTKSLQLIWRSTGTRSSNEYKWFDLNIAYHYISPNEGEMPHCLDSTMGTWKDWATVIITVRLHSTHVMDIPLTVRSRQYPRVHWRD